MSWGYGDTVSKKAKKKENEKKITALCYVIIFNCAGICKMHGLFKNGLGMLGAGGSCYHPIYLGGWDGEDCRLRPAWANSR
jgi:hypothetical protein